MFHSEVKNHRPVAEMLGDGEPVSRAKAVLTEPVGWDPFEVWRERIKQPRDLSGQSSRPQVPRKRQKS